MGPSQSSSAPPSPPNPTETGAPGPATPCTASSHTSSQQGWEELAVGKRWERQTCTTNLLMQEELQRKTHILQDLQAKLCLQARRSTTNRGPALSSLLGNWEESSITSTYGQQQEPNPMLPEPREGAWVPLPASTWRACPWGRRTDRQPPGPGRHLGLLSLLGFK